MEDEKYKHAKARVDRLKGFYSFLGVYIIVNIMLFAIDFIPDGRIDWAYWSLLGLSCCLRINRVPHIRDGCSPGQELGGTQDPGIHGRRFGQETIKRVRRNLFTAEPQRSLRLIPVNRLASF